LTLPNYGTAEHARQPKWRRLLAPRGFLHGKHYICGSPPRAFPGTCSKIKTPLPKIQMDSIDHGRTFDWDRTSQDYARYRPGYPPSFYERIASLGVGLPGQRVLDLGTGTGNVARELARRGCKVTGVDISERQIAEARRLSTEEG